MVSLSSSRSVHISRLYSRHVGVPRLARGCARTRHCGALCINHLGGTHDFGDVSGQQTVSHRLSSLLTIPLRISTGVLLRSSTRTTPRPLSFTCVSTRHLHGKASFVFGWMLGRLWWHAMPILPISSILYSTRSLSSRMARNFRPVCHSHLHLSFWLTHVAEVMPPAYVSAEGWRAD